MIVVPDEAWWEENGWSRKHSGTYFHEAAEITYSPRNGQTCVHDYTNESGVVCYPKSAKDLMLLVRLFTPPT